MRFHHFAIEVKDLETTAAFYQDILGLQEERRFHFNEENIVFLASNDFRLELLSGGEGPIQQAVHICFEVDRINEVINRLNKNGIATLEGPYKLENGWETVFFEGPNHEVIEFLQVK